MAASVRAHRNIIMSTAQSQPVDNGVVLVWLDDSAEGDPNVKGILSSLFDKVLIYTDSDSCLELIESMEGKASCMSILISGKYGQMLVHKRLQPLIQIKYIYVFCFDIVKHSQWAQTCDKVRCVYSDISKVLKCMEHDVQNTIEQQQQQPQQQVIQKQQYCERYTDDNDLYDQLALNLLLDSPDDGAEDFTNYCQTYNKNNKSDDNMNEDEDDQEEVQEPYFKPEQPIADWYHPNLFFTHINSNDLAKLWTVRWFIRFFHRQLVHEQDNFIPNSTKLTVHHGSWLSTDELDAMKYRIGQIIIITELLMTYANRQKALESFTNNYNQKHKVIFEINIDTIVRSTLPYAEIRKDEILIWFGGRYRLIKIEYIESEDDEQNAYWIIGLNLCSSSTLKPSIQNLYEYYLEELTNLNNIHHAFGRILMYKGCYSQAEAWLEIDHQYCELTELAIRQCHYEQAQQYLEDLSEDSDNANLLRAYLNILTSNDNFSKARLILMKILSESNDKLIRAQVNITLGFINLIHTQNIDQAYEYFTLGNDVLRKLLPDIHPYIAKSFIGIGYTYYIQHNIIDARKSFELAYNIQKESLICNHSDFAKIRNARAHCLSTDKQTIKQAFNEFEYALEILLDTFPNEEKYHSEILVTIKDIDELKKGKELLARPTLLDYI